MEGGEGWRVEGKICVPYNTASLMTDLMGYNMIITQKLARYRHKVEQTVNELPQ